MRGEHLYVLADPEKLTPETSEDGLNHIINTNAVPHCAPREYTPDWSAERPADRFMLRLSCTGHGLLKLNADADGVPSRTSIRLRY